MTDSSVQRSKRRAQRGFSLVELVVVVAIALVIAAIAIPNAIRAWYNMELRATASQVSDLMQQARIMAARNNSYYTLCYRMNGTVQQVYLTQVTLSSTTACTYTQGTSVEIDLARMITASTAAPTGSNPSALTLATDTTSGTPYDNATTLAFSPRGLPCKFDTTAQTCAAPSPTYFVYYFQASSSNGWAGVLVTKAGRTKAYTWNGSSWN
jgi:prepilin-type N-terminal cleavage/methylation domain-containing protein